MPGAVRNFTPIQQALAADGAMVPARLYQAVRPLSLLVSSVLVRKSENI
jgi:hypothetical protein